jgi:general secretion pathway protein A
MSTGMYESFYGLRRTPFRLTPDPYFFYGSGTHKRGLAYLRYAVRQGGGFVVITGDPGTGKTKLMLNLIAEQSHPRSIFARIVSTNLNIDDLLGLVVSSFGRLSEGVNKGTLLNKLENFLIARVREGKESARHRHYPAKLSL